MGIPGGTTFISFTEMWSFFIVLHDNNYQSTKKNKPPLWWLFFYFFSFLGRYSLVFFEAVN
ncbi:MAG: hypothetical protein RSF68_14945, partial [Myroides sp.]